MPWSTCTSSLMFCCGSMLIIVQSSPKSGTLFGYCSLTHSSQQLIDSRASSLMSSPSSLQGRTYCRLKSRSRTSEPSMYVVTAFSCVLKKMAESPMSSTMALVFSSLIAGHVSAHSLTSLAFVLIVMPPSPPPRSARRAA